MASNALVTTRIDATIKEEAASVLATIGLTVSDAIRLMLIKISNEHALPFDPFIPNEKTVAAMKEARRGGGKSFRTVRELMEDLNADD